MQVFHHLEIWQKTTSSFSVCGFLYQQLHADPAMTQNSSWPSATVTLVGTYNLILETQDLLLTVLYKHVDRAQSNVI